MTETTWLDPSKPGVPLHPENDGWHWVKAHPNNLKATRLEEFPAIWTAGNQHWIRGTYPPEYAAKNWIYLAPVLAPDEAAALQKRVAELEAALDFYACIDHYQTHNAVAPNVVQSDRGAKARAALGGKDE